MVKADTSPFPVPVLEWWGPTSKLLNLLTSGGKAASGADVLPWSQRGTVEGQGAEGVLAGA